MTTKRTVSKGADDLKPSMAGGTRDVLSDKCGRSLKLSNIEISNIISKFEE